MLEREPTTAATAADNASDAAPLRYAGLVTRAVALGLDLLAANVIFSLIGGAVGLIAAAVGDQGGLSAIEVAIGAFVWWTWVVVYFVVFWTLTGQTLGNRVLGIRVVRAIGGTVSLGQGLLRVVGFVLAAIPLGAGFLPILVDDQRRGLQDRIAKTVVIWSPDESSGTRRPEARHVAASPEPQTAAAPTGAAASRGPGSPPGPQIPRIS